MMTGIVARIARWGFAILFGALLTSVVSGEASARHRNGHLHAHLHAHHAFANSHAELVSPQPAQLGAMRYYGGPKSPMWRGPADNEASRGSVQGSSKAAMLVRQQPAQLGPMRYYGGPKSPMWRGPAEN
ncbi:hypothetical protein UP10_32135 [Bradyrhizobium sp. LTSPM299]|jgi:hypothetical protein|nr:hypothetical protein UP10_32135 [Bradyrhizobium sp. LTSPM299]